MIYFVIILLIIIFFGCYVEIFPLVKEKIVRKRIKKKHVLCEEKILAASIKMLESNNITMIWDDTITVVGFLRFNWRKIKNRKFYYYHFPRGFLFYGTIKYLKKRGKAEQRNLLLSIKNRFDMCFDNTDALEFNLTVIDQSVFGLSAIELYDEFGDEKYLNFVNLLLSFIVEHRDEGDVIRYRNQQPLYLVDTIGMVVEFLVKAGKLLDRNDLGELAKNQVQFYIQEGVDDKTGYPFHAIVKSTLHRVGPSNWGRGIGWFCLGLNACYKDQNLFSEHRDKLKKSLHADRLSDFAWSQFLGTSLNVDSSSTLMFIYTLYMTELGQIGKNGFLEKYCGFVDDRGYVGQSSGDTKWINSYSSAAGRSELSQGILMLILAELE